MVSEAIAGAQGGTHRALADRFLDCQAAAQLVPVPAPAGCTEEPTAPGEPPGLSYSIGK